MRVFKPFRASFVHRCFDHRKKHFFVSSVLVSIPFDRPRAVATEPELWKMAQGELGRFGVLDFWMIKTEGEVLATGPCFTGANPKQDSYIRIAVFPGEPGDNDRPLIDRRLMVFGDRRWTLSGMTHPEPFTEMPVDYSRAFGGEKFDKNPIGRGMAPITEDGEEVFALPNVEDPRQLIANRTDRPNPGSPGPMDPTWPANFKRIGSYDFDYAKKHAPGFADDIDFGMFNVAAPEQRLKGFWNGDERLRVENMHPTKPVLETRLPAFMARTFLRFTSQYAKTDAEKDLVEMPMRLDTVHLFPRHERAVLVFRGLREIYTADATDIETALIALEDRDGDRRPITHYREAFDNRADRTKLAKFVLNDKDLMPDRVESAGPGVHTGDRLDEVVMSEGLLHQNLDRKRHREMTETRQRLIDEGADPELLPEVAPPVGPRTMPALDDVAEMLEDAQQQAEDAKKTAEAERAKAEEQVRAMCEEEGLSYEQVIADRKKEASGPPKFSAQGELEKLREIYVLSRNAGEEIPGIAEKLASEDFLRTLVDTEIQLVEAYRLTAHEREPASKLDTEASAKARAELELRVRGAPFDRRDFTGADLSKLDLSGADLRGAFFEHANLSEAKLAGANLEGAVFAHADLSGADLTGANLKNANLGRTKLEKAKLTSAIVTDAILVGCNARDADLSKIVLDRTTVRDMMLEGARLDELQASETTFLKCQLNRVNMRGAKLRVATFIDCDLAEADFSGGDILETAFFMCRGEKSVFVRSKLDNLRIVHECNFERAMFTGSHMPRTNVRGTKLAHADFSDCDLSQSDLSSADLSDANLTKAILRESLLMDTNLTRAKLRGANMMQIIAHRVIVRGADVSKANLFASDLSHAVGDDKTSFAGTNLKRVFAAGGFVG